MPHDDLPLLTFADAESLRRWLDEQGETSRGAWLRFAKQGAPEPTVSKSDAIDCALAYGWVDGQLGSLDAHYFKTRFTPRRPRSAWSQINRERVERLERAGRMHPRGRAQVEQAKADGRWAAAYPGQGKAAPDADLEAALDAEPAAREQFDALDSANRFAILYRVQQARTPEKRAAKIAEMVSLLRRHDPPPPRQARAQERRIADDGGHRRTSPDTTARP
ncbi:MAG TPA: YdeI/OmpD-associated family protein [Phenylobacterium sp.]|jgi:uncharacterized protein YdeI (YjbR/CyaY-like superfamily)